MSIADLTLIDATQIARVGDYADLVEALRRAHCDQAAECERLVYGPAGSDARFMALPAWAPGDAIGVKLVTIFPNNPRRGMPSVQAIVALFDGDDGRPLALLDGTELTYRKTAADSALGASLLARHDVQVMLMVGAGGLAPHLIAAHRAVRPSIEHVVVWNRTPTAAENLVAAGTADEVAPDLATAIPRADVICTATMAREPLIRGELVQPGTHVDAVGAYLPDHREVDDELVRRAEIFVDSRQAAVREDGDLVIPLATGVIDHDAIRADLFELCRGAHPGRAGDDSITLFENGGGGHLDLMVARHVWSSLATGGGGG